jgi:hypothetical protein
LEIRDIICETNTGVNTMLFICTNAPKGMTPMWNIVKGTSKEEEEKMREEERKNNPKKVLVQLKKYNKETKDQTMKLMKNRSNNNTVLPPQIKANLPILNNQSEKQLLKENANRYTWEGRLTNFCPLKKIDRKIVDKKYSKEYVYYDLSGRKYELINLASGGSAIPILNKNHFSMINILLPLEKFLFHLFHLIRKFVAWVRRK